MKLNAMDLKWLESETRRLINACKRSSDDVTIFMPDCSGHYNALWTRDFAYYVENVPDMITDDELRRACEFLIAGQRKDGWAPDRVTLDGEAVYSAGSPNSPVADACLDNGMFLVKIAHNYVRHSRDRGFLRKVIGNLEAALAVVPLSRDGLVWNDPENPHSPYGFTDCIGKTGDLLFCSILYWEAAKMLHDLARMIDDDEVATNNDYRAWMIENRLTKLWSESDGVFLAATTDCRQIDIWGNIYLIYVDFPVQTEWRDRIGSFLVENYSEYTFNGMVRHLLAGEYWDRLLVNVGKDTYQNGAYWSVPTGWLISVLTKFDHDLAEKTARQFISYSREHGFWECVGPGDYRKLRDYVPSAANPTGGIRRALDEGMVLLYR